MAIWEENDRKMHWPWEWAGAGARNGIRQAWFSRIRARRARVDRGSLFGARTFGWLRARGSLEVERLASQIDKATDLEVLGPAVCSRLSLG
jgi:hypothetical protein